jgi:hypothetical protein
MITPSDVMWGMLGLLDRYACVSKSERRSAYMLESSDGLPRAPQVTIVQAIYGEVKYRKEEDLISGCSKVGR